MEVEVAVVLMVMKVAVMTTNVVAVMVMKGVMLVRWRRGCRGYIIYYI